ncbi:MAG TPA: metal-dependent phosphohydrolase [Desulfobulbaceae bacterium]|nr:metal-dependent phosphohydrolase [Desulfobulbaceae bacterium]
MHLKQLSPLWRDEKVIAREEEQEKFQFQSPRATAFMVQISRGPCFKKFPEQKAVCGRILQLLDREGRCPSVVDLKNDVEGNWDENTFQLLGRTSLLDHSINVAEQVAQLLADADDWHIIPDTMVAALGHDLGKLISMRSYLYSTGEHPLVAGRPLAGIAGFNELRRKDEILQAIKLHHKKPQGLIGRTLKAADQKARQKELEEAVQKIETGAADPVSENPAPGKKQRCSDNTAAWQAQEDIYNQDQTGQERTKGEKPELMDISGWFDAAGFLDELKPYINKMFGRRFLAFSMADGYVYFQTKVLEEVARKMAERAGSMEIATMGRRDESMRGVLLTIVNHLRAEHDVIARGLIKESYFGGYFNVTRKIGKPMKGYYTPFHAEAFGSIAEMEHDKPKMLRNIIKVSPYTDDTDT